MSDFTFENVRTVINKALRYYRNETVVERNWKAYMALKNGRNRKGNYPKGILDSNDEVNASAEHYLLCRAYISNGKWNQTQMFMAATVYNASKFFGVAKRHNPNNPTSPLTDTQKHFQYMGIKDGEEDRRVSRVPEQSFKIGSAVDAYYSN